MNAEVKTPPEGKPMDGLEIPIWPDEEVRPFLDAVRLSGEDELAALVFADWLEERGDPRAAMIRASCPKFSRSAEGQLCWTPEYDRLLEAWIGPMEECYFWVRGLERGLLVLGINNYRGSLTVEEEEYPQFFAARHQGWLGQVAFGGLPSAIFDQTPLLQSLVSEAARLEVYAATSDACDDDLSGVCKLPNLAELMIEDFSGFTDAGLAYLRNHPQLEWVSLSGEFTATGYEHLRTLPRLRRADVTGYR